MHGTLKYSLVILIILFQSNIQPAYAAKPIITSIGNIQKDNKENHPKTNKLAKWSLILVNCGFLTAIIPTLTILSPYLIVGGIVSSIISLFQIKKNKEKGKGLAIASIVLVGLTLLSILAVSDMFSGFIFNW